MLLHLPFQLLASFDKAEQQHYDQMGVSATCKHNIVMALLKKWFDDTPGGKVDLFSRRVSLLAAEGPNFRRGFVEIQYSKCYHILFLIQMKNKSPKFPGKSHS